MTLFYDEEYYQVVEDMGNVETLMEREIYEAVKPVLAEVCAWEIGKLLDEYFGRLDLSSLTGHRNTDFDVWWAVGRHGTDFARLVRTPFGNGLSCQESGSGEGSQCKGG
jgi:hypothetical protein